MHLEKKVILIDSDGVVVDLAKHWVEEYNKEYKDSLTVEEFVWKWDGMEEAVKPECGEKIYDYLRRPGFFQACEPYSGAVASLKKFFDDERYDCYIVSAYSGSAEAAKGKIEWYEKHCLFVDTERIILCKPKFLVRGDVLIDDSYKNIKQWVDKHTPSKFEGDIPIGILIAQAHNEDFSNKKEVAQRLPSLGEAYKFLNVLF
jgi:5'(3')-deoxyribonucleotidase